MKNFYVMVALVIALAFLSGCATSGPSDYDKYLVAVQSQAEHQKPTFSISCDDPDGCNFGSLEYMDPRDRLNIQQKAPSPGWLVLGDTVKWTGRILLGGIIVDGVEEILGAVAAGTTYTNAFNNVGRDNTVLDTQITTSGESVTTTSFDTPHNDQVVMEAPSEEGGEETSE